MSDKDILIVPYRCHHFKRSYLSSHNEGEDNVILNGYRLATVKRDAELHNHRWNVWSLMPSWLHKGSRSAVCLIVVRPCSLMTTSSLYRCKPCTPPSTKSMLSCSNLRSGSYWRTEPHRHQYHEDARSSRTLICEAEEAQETIAEKQNHLTPSSSCVGTVLLQFTWYLSQLLRHIQTDGNMV